MFVFNVRKRREKIKSIPLANGWCSATEETRWQCKNDVSPTIPISRLSKYNVLNAECGTNFCQPFHFLFRQGKVQRCAASATWFCHYKQTAQTNRLSNPNARRMLYSNNSVQCRNYTHFTWAYWQISACEAPYQKSTYVMTFFWWFNANIVESFRLSIHIKSHFKRNKGFGLW